MPASPGGEERGELVESGGFRVDRGRALEKIRSFRNEAVGAVSLFVRAAVASGARSLAVREEADAVSLAWDGSPLRPSFFGDPYASLFTEDPGDRRAERWMALGLLHAFGPALRRARVESGAGRLEAVELAGESSSQREAAPGTSVRLELSGAAERLWDHPHARLDGEPAGVVWADLALAWPARRRWLVAPEPQPGGEGVLAWKEGTVFGRLEAPERDHPMGLLKLHVDGVLAGFIELDKDSLRVGGRAEDPTLALDASLTSYVNGPRTEAIRAQASSRAKEFLAKTVLEQATRMPRTASALRENDWLKRLWVRRLREEADVDGSVERLLTAPGASAGQERAEAARRVLHDARVTVWLRRLFSRASEAPLAGLLESAPLALGAGLEALTGSFLLRQAGRIPEVPIWDDGAVPDFWSALKSR